VVPSTLYAGAGLYSAGGIFKSIDSGRTRVVLVPYGAIQCLAIDPASPTTLFAGGWNGLFKSTSSGGTWAVASTDARLSHVRWRITAAFRPRPPRRPST
jgi:hypothetical protein